VTGKSFFVYAQKFSAGLCIFPLQSSALLFCHTQANVEKQANAAEEAFKNNKEKLDDLTSSIEFQKSRIDSVISDFQDQFLKGQSERSERIEQLIEQTKSEFNNFISIKGTTIEEQMNKQQEEHDTQLNKNEIEFDEQMANQEKNL